MKKTSSLRSKKPLRSKSNLKASASLKSKNTLSKKPKTPIGKLKKLADQVHSRATRLRFAEWRDGDYWAECITCKVEKPIKALQCGHFMSRQYNILRYDERNTAPQCYGCNVMQQGRQYTFGIEIDKLYGDGVASELHEESKQSKQWKPHELEEIIEDRRKEIEFYEKDRAIN